MEVTTIKMSLKLSKETAAGWRGLELGAEATIAKTESLEASASALYGQLRGEFAKLWNANGLTASDANPEPITPEPVVTVETKRVEEAKTEPATDTDAPATDAQIRMIFGKAKEMGLPSKTVREIALAAYGVNVDNLTKWAASQFISSLKNHRIPAKAS